MVLSKALLSWFLLSAHAGGLSPAVDTETTSILPSKIRTVRFKQYFVNVEEKFDSQGQQNPLGQSLNKSIKWVDLLNTQKGPAKDLAKASLEAQGIDLNGEGPGSLTGEVNMTVDVKVPILGYGINERHSVGLIVPIYTMKTSVATSFVTTKTGEKWFNSIQSPATKAQVKEQLEGALTQRLKAFGYQPLQSEKISDVGDILLVHKVLLGEYSDDSLGTHSFLWRNEVVAPTGTEPNADKVIDLATGDGQWDLGMGLNYQYATHFKELRLPMSYMLHAFYNHQFEDSLERRIPIEAGSSISPDKEVVDRKLGDQVSLGGAVSFGNGRDGSSVSVGYNYQYMLPTKFEGNRYANERYKWLENLNDQSNLESMLFLYSFSTVDKYLNKTFPVPLTWTLSYARPLSGENVNDSEVYYTELQLFF